nr:PREDICTED: protein SZT2 [Latimeria chalumnae]|eukprot:XP_014351126.1 PREDICTED: protein SZT2 [Latimeria chalumnae]
MAERQQDTQVEEASQVFLLMKKEYRISRNVRLAWFLGNLHHVIHPTPRSELVSHMWHFGSLPPPHHAMPPMPFSLPDFLHPVLLYAQQRALVARKKLLLQLCNLCFLLLASQHKLFNEHLVSASSNPALAMRRKKHTEKEVHANLVCVVSVRLREGYSIREVNLAKAGSQLEVKLVLLWKHNMRIEYLASAPWPLDPSKRSTWVEVTMEGSYDILHDISCTMRKPISSLYRTTVIRRFWNTLQSINQTDQMLVHLQSFNTIPEHFTIPESTKNGVPLFYIPPGSTTPVLSLQHSGSKDSSQSQFASYWKPILSMDANFWQRWLHMHRISIILEHDTPVPKHLHTPGSNGRYSTIQCRISHSALTSLLRDWSSFVLVEGYSYVKLIYSSTDQSPSFFYLVRIISKAPCMVLRLGFPIGTPAFTRNKIVDELRDQILLLRFPHRVQSKEATPKVKRKILGGVSPSVSPPLPPAQPALSDRPCVEVLTKPLEKLLIRYEKLPSDYRTSFILNLESASQSSAVPGPVTVATSRTASSMLASLSRYYYHRRWIWSVHSGLAPGVPLAAVAQILAMITDKSLLLQRLMLYKSPEDQNYEVDKSNALDESGGEIHTCLVQYILFPPHSISTKDSFSTDDDNDTEVEAIEYDTELNLVTECWVEPQSGHVTSPSENHRHLNGLSYLEIPKAIYPRDQACMSTMLTFEYLCQLCLNKDHASPICGAKCTAGDRLGDTEHIHEIPFQFDLMKLLPKCQQVEIFFLTLSKEDAGSVQEGSPLPNDTLLSLFHGCLQQDLSDREIPLADLDHVTFMQQVLQRERDGHVPPFTLPAVKEDTMKPSRPSEREDAAMSFHAMGSSKEVTGSTSTLQSVTSPPPPQNSLVHSFLDVQKLTTLGPDRNAKHDDLGGEEMLEVQVIKPAPAAPSGGLQPKSELSAAGEDRGSPEVPAEGVPSMGGVDGSKATLPPSQQESVPSRPAPAMPLTQMEELPGLETGGENVTSQTEAVSDCGELGALPAKELHFSFSHQMSQLDPNDSSRLRCPVYVYNCSFELLRGQLVTPHLDRPVKDVFFSEFRSQDFGCWEIFPEKKPRIDMVWQQRFRLSEGLEEVFRHFLPLVPLVAGKRQWGEGGGTGLFPLWNFAFLWPSCSLSVGLRSSTLAGLFRSLQQSFSVASQDLLTAMDYCEELLQEIEITTFLQTLCGHIRTFRESHDLQRAREAQRQPTTFVIGRRGRGEEASRERGVLTSVSSAEMEDYSEPESRSVSSAVASPVTAEEPKAKQAYPEFPLSLLQSGQPCEVYPNLHKIIQDKFLEIGRQHFKTVPSNPFYFFYCPPSAKKEEEPCPEDGSRKPSEDADLSEADFALEEGNVSGCCIATESDPDLEVEYRDRSDRELQDSSDSASDSNTVNQDDDSFSVLGGDSLNEQDVLEQEMPPLFVHLTCSVKVKSCHGSLPVQSLPTCLGKERTAFKLACCMRLGGGGQLGTELDAVSKTYTSESSISLTRSPGQPSSYRSDDGMMPNMDHLTSAADDGLSAADPLSKLPITHRQAVEATMSEIHWLLEDEIVSALRHSKNIGVSTLRQVSEHVYRSHGRPRCHMEVVPLQFVFGSEQSLEKFKEEFRRMTLPGHLLNEEDHYFYVSRSRYHSQRLAMAMKATEPSPGSETESRVAAGGDEVGARQQQDGENEAEAAPEVVIASDSEKSREKKVEREEFQDGKPECAAELRSDGNTAPPSEQPERATAPALVTEQTATDGLQPQQSPATESSEKPPSKNSSIVSLTELAHSAPHGSVGDGSRQHHRKTMQLVDWCYDGDSSESECEGGTMSTQEPRCPLMPDFWLIIEILHDRVKVYSHARDLAGVKDSSEVKEDKGSEEEPEHFCLHRTVVKKIGELCRVANQRLLLQDLHDSHVCNSLLVAESEEDIWKSETSYNSYRQRIIANDDYSADESYQSRDYLAATMQFIPGHFACDVVWKTIIYIHPRLKMGPNMGVARAIQALRSVLTAFSVVNRKNMFVYQERSTKSVFYLRLCWSSQVNGSAGTSWLLKRLPNSHCSPERLISSNMGSRSSLEFTPSRSSEPSRPVGQVDKHILLMVHGVGAAGPEITDELVKVLRRRLDEATLDIITVMLVRNCKLTPADVEFIQPPNTTPTEVIQFTIPQSSLAWLHAVAYYLRQNLLIFLHTPKYTDSNIENHFQHCVCQDRSHSSADIYLYNKPGGQGTGGKGTMWDLVQHLFPPSQFQGTYLFIVGAFPCFHENPPPPNPLLPSFSPHFVSNISTFSFFLVSIPVLEELTFLVCAHRKRLCHLEEGDVGALHPLFGHTCQQWMAFMCRLGCPSIQRCSVDIVSRFLLSSILTETMNLVTNLANDTTVKVFERIGLTSALTVGKNPAGVGGVEIPQVSCVRCSEDDDDDDDNASLVNRFKPSVSYKAIHSLAAQVNKALNSSVFNKSAAFFWFCISRATAGNSPDFCSAPHFLTPPLFCFPTLAHKGFQRFEAPETSSVSDSPSAGTSGKEVVPRQRFLIIDIIDKKMTLYTYNWSVDLGATLNRNLTQLIQWQNARSHVVYGLLNQKMGLFHHYCFADAPGHDENKQDPNPFLNSSLEADTLIRTPMPPASKEQNRLSGASRGPPSLHFPTDIVPFDEVLRDISVLGYVQQMPDSGISDPVSRHGTQYLEIKNMERREMEKQLKIENLFVTWQQRSAESNMPITVADLETLKQSSRLVHYCATPLLFDPLFRQQIQAELRVVPEGKKRHRSNDSTASGRDRSHSCDSVEMLSSKLKEEPWLVDIFNIFMQQYIQYLQSTGFILVQVRPPSPARSSGRIRSLACLTSEGRSSFSYSKQKSEESPKSGSCSVPTYHLQRALPGGIVLMELAFQGCYFCVKQYALECSRIPMGQSVNSQLSMLFTEECDKVRDLMHVHSFSYDFHLRIVHQYLVGCHMTLHQGYHLTGFLEDFISQHPDIPKFGRNHVFQGTLALPTSMITAHQLYNYITDHAGTYGMKPLRMSKTTVSSDSKKGSQYTELHEYALVALWNSSGSYKDSEGLRHHDDFDVSLLVCHSASPFEEQTETERHLLRLCFYVIMTSQRELFPRLTADMRRFKKLPQLRRDPLDHLRPSASKASWEKTETDLWEEEGEERQAQMGGSIFLRVPRFQLLLSEVALAQKRIGAIVQEAKSHCRRDNLWQRLFLGENLSSDKLKLSKLSFPELEELLKAVQSKSISEIDPQLDCFVTMNVSWYQGLIKVLLTRFPQSCRHFVDNDNGIQYLAVLNQKFIDCFVLVYLDVQAGKTSLKVVFREPFPVQPQNSESPLPQLVSMYHHLESVINTACFNLWTGLL